MICEWKRFIYCICESHSLICHESELVFRIESNVVRESTCFRLNYYREFLILSTRMNDMWMKMLYLLHMWITFIDMSRIWTSLSNWAECCSKVNVSSSQLLSRNRHSFEPKEWYVHQNALIDAYVNHIHWYVSNLN